MIAFEWIGLVLVFGIMVFWRAGGFQATFAFLARRQEMKHKERMAKIQASNKNRVERK